MLPLSNHTLSSILALLLGFIIGFERRYHSHSEEEHISMIALFTLVSLFGFLVIYIVGSHPIATISISFVAGMVILVQIIQEEKEMFGMTTSAALIILLLTGSMIGMGYHVEAALVVILVLVLLVMKEEAHYTAEVLTDRELMSALRFLAIAAIILPLAMTVGVVHSLIGPGKVIDPVKSLLMIIFVSSFSFSSYIVIRYVSAEKGIEVTAILGGLVSSTAAAASMAQRVKRIPDLINSSSRGITLTIISMMVKDLILISVLAGLGMTYILLIPILIMITVPALWVLVFQKRGGVDIELRLDSPFAILPAAKFGAMYTFISVATYFLKDYLGSYGVYGSSIGGLISTTSVSAALGTLYAAGQIRTETVLVTFLLSMFFGIVSKMMISWYYDRDLAKKVIFPLSVSSLIALLAVALTLIGK